MDRRRLVSMPRRRVTSPWRVDIAVRRGSTGSERARRCCAKLRLQSPGRKLPKSRERAASTRGRAAVALRHRAEQRRMTATGDAEPGAPARRSPGGQGGGGPRRHPRAPPRRPAPPAAEDSARPSEGQPAWTAQLGARPATPPGTPRLIQAAPPASPCRAPAQLPSRPVLPSGPLPRARMVTACGAAPAGCRPWVLLHRARQCRQGSETPSQPRPGTAGWRARGRQRHLVNAAARG